MEELAKCKRAIGKRLANAPHETLLVLDGTTGDLHHGLPCRVQYAVHLAAKSCNASCTLVADGR